MLQLDGKKDLAIPLAHNDLQNNALKNSYSEIKFSNRGPQ